ncbi:hypothetical protein ABID92_001110 [Frigoribacterium sp. PvP120]|uniref:hypothetical protein n=1 Tax=unclassified Frigoribacterium TaxID=2627005 RepID=UPI001AE8A9F4|nr:hypothetical protein [Frigoribacterium sp. PvP121]MBP1241073.1 hypothetical protein [Frigoribacterium sp. PvP121]
MTDERSPRADGTDDHAEGRVDEGRPEAGAPAVDFGGPAEPARDPADDQRGEQHGEHASAPAVDFGGPAEPARDPADDERDSSDSATRALPVTGDEPGRHDDGVEPRGELFPPAASLADDQATPTTADGSVAAAEVPGGDQGRRVDAGDGRGTTIDGDASVDPDQIDRERRDGVDRDGETEVIAPLSSDDRDHDHDARHDGDGDGDADRRDDATVPPVVAPVAPGARAWSAGSSSDDDGPRRPLHDDEALRAAEAARAEPVRDSSERDGDRDRDADRDRDSRDGAVAVGAGAAAAAGAGAAAAHARSDDGRIGDARTAATPAAGRTPTGAVERDRTGGYPTTDDGDIDRVGLRRDLLAEQKEEFGGMRFGAGLLGWFAATGLGVVLFSILASITAAVVVGSSPSASPLALQQTMADQGPVLSLVVGIGVLVIVFVGYLVGGYTASRVARFSGLKQGLATWLWGLVITIVTSVVVGVVAVQAGDQSSPNSMVPTVDDLTSMSVESLIFLGLVLVLSLLGALLGGVLGQRWHRRVDRFIPEHQV